MLVGNGDAVLPFVSALCKLLAVSQMRANADISPRGLSRPKAVAGMVFFGSEAVVKFNRLGIDRRPNNMRLTGLALLPMVQLNMGANGNSQYAPFFLEATNLTVPVRCQNLFGALKRAATSSDANLCQCACLTGALGMGCSPDCGGHVSHGQTYCAKEKNLPRRFEPKPRVRWLGCP